MTGRRGDNAIRGIVFAIGLVLLVILAALVAMWLMSGIAGVTP